MLVKISLFWGIEKSEFLLGGFVTLQIGLGARLACATAKE